MEDLFSSLTERLAAWAEAVTGTVVQAEDFRLPRAAGHSSLRRSSLGQLSLGVFVTGDADAAARKLKEALPACPQVREVREKNGWLLFWLSNGWFDELIGWAMSLDTRPTGSYVENRMGMLARRGMAPCPDAEPVRQALWAAYLAFRRGSWRAADERLVLTMTHERSDADRIALEDRCGGVAAAIEKLKGERP